MSWAEPGVIETALHDAGFEDVEVDAVDFTFEFASTDAHFEHQADMSTRIAKAAEGLSPADHYRLREAIDSKLEAHANADGSVSLPARTWVAAASA